MSAAFAVARTELGKLPAFVRRDFLIALSYRTAFAGDILFLGGQMVVFAFIGRLVDSNTLPTYGGSPTTYMEFVAIGIVLSLVVGVLLGRVATAMRQEQVQGTLEALLATPSAVGTVQAGSVAFDLLWVPIRMLLFLAVITLTFGLDLELAGVPKAAVLMLAFLPFVWGLGLLSAAAILAFRRGSGATALVISFLGIASGAYFPLTLLPGWLQAVGEVNPFARVLEGMRETLLGGAGWGPVAADAALLLLPSVALLAAGAVAFRIALARERRNGTLGLY
jgi:ABC-2 type transport system permease protein